jgi:hypothetical protein
MQMFIALIVFTNTTDHIIKQKLYLIKHNEKKTQEWLEIKNEKSLEIYLP